MVGLKIPSGSLTGYYSNGDAWDGSVKAEQNAVIPKWTKFKVASEMQSRYSLCSSTSTLMSSRDLNVGTMSSLDSTASRSRTTIRSA
ncbi:MAG TPA: hypothetical protein PKK68_05275 [Methanothrix soehngenii]|nr:hypothetical protein [Methanothrix soehngenii]